MTQQQLIIKEKIKRRTDNQRKNKKIQEEQIMDCLMIFLALEDPNQEDQDERNRSTEQCPPPGLKDFQREEYQTLPHVGDTCSNQNTYMYIYINTIYYIVKLTKSYRLD